MHCLDEGPRMGDTVVMLHGNPTWSFYYRHVIAALSSTHRCIVPDHIGMGLSDKPCEEDYNYTLDQRVDDLDELLSKLDLPQKLTLVVHDWGGMIGMAWATRRPERIEKLVILNTGAFHLPATMAMPWQLVLCRGPFGEWLVRGCNAFCLDAVKNCATRRALSPGACKAYLEPYDSWQNRVAIYQFVKDIPLDVGENAYNTVSHVQSNLSQFADVPMLVCWGMKDFVFTEHFLNEWTRRFPKAAVHRLDDAGHYILEDAHEEVVPLIQRFVNG